MSPSSRDTDLTVLELTGLVRRSKLSPTEIRQACSELKQIAEERESLENRIAGQKQWVLASLKSEEPVSPVPWAMLDTDPALLALQLPAVPGGRGPILDTEGKTVENRIRSTFEAIKTKVDQVVAKVKAQSVTYEELMDLSSIVEKCHAEAGALEREEKWEEPHEGFLEALQEVDGLLKEMAAKLAENRSSLGQEMFDFYKKVVSQRREEE